MKLSGRKLTLIAFDRDITLSDVARAAGVSRQTLYGIKSGRKCSEATAQKIAKALNVAVEYLQE